MWTKVPAGVKGTWDASAVGLGRGEEGMGLEKFSGFFRGASCPVFPGGKDPGWGDAGEVAKSPSPCQPALSSPASWKAGGWGVLGCGATGLALPRERLRPWWGAELDLFPLPPTSRAGGWGPYPGSGDPQSCAALACFPQVPPSGLAEGSFFSQAGASGAPGPAAQGVGLPAWPWPRVCAHLGGLGGGLRGLSGSLLRAARPGSGGGSCPEPSAHPGSPQWP